MPPKAALPPLHAIPYAIPFKIGAADVICQNHILPMHIRFVQCPKVTWYKPEMARRRPQQYTIQINTIWCCKHPTSSNYCEIFCPNFLDGQPSKRSNKCDVNLLQCTMELMECMEDIASTVVSMDHQRQVSEVIWTLCEIPVSVCAAAVEIRQRNTASDSEVSGLAKCLAPAGPTYPCLTLTYLNILKAFPSESEKSETQLLHIPISEQKISSWDLEKQLPSLACDCHLPFSWGFSIRGTPCCKGAAWEPQNAHVRFCLCLTTFNSRSLQQEWNRKE